MAVSSRVSVRNLTEGFALPIEDFNGLIAVKPSITAPLSISQYLKPLTTIRLILLDSASFLAVWESKNVFPDGGRGFGPRITSKRYSLESSEGTLSPEMFLLFPSDSLLFQRNL